MFVVITDIRGTIPSSTCATLSEAILVAQSSLYTTRIYHIVTGWVGTIRKGGKTYAY